MNLPDPLCYCCYYCNMGRKEIFWKKDLKKWKHDTDDWNYFRFSCCFSFSLFYFSFFLAFFLILYECEKRKGRKTKATSEKITKKESKFLWKCTNFFYWYKLKFWWKKQLRVLQRLSRSNERQKRKNNCRK